MKNGKLQVGIIGCGGIVHRNITIKNNTFNAIRGRCLYLSAIEGAKVECNIYNDCVNGEYMTIESINCKNISIVDWKSSISSQHVYTGSPNLKQ